MKSPLTGGEVELRKEQRKLTFRKENFNVMYHFYVCVDTKEQFTSTEIDTLNINQVYNQYREKYGIPFTDEIIKIRHKYGLSAAKMSEVLGLGPNSYRNYEAGEIPSVANGRLIRLAEDPLEFAKLLDMSKKSLLQQEYDRVLKKVENAINTVSDLDELWMQYFFGTKYPNIRNGYKTPSIEKVGLMTSYFAKHNKPYTTAMNKLMFYADFGHYQKHGSSISGVSYKALPKGPVPDNYGFLYNQVTNAGFVEIAEYNFGEYVGEMFIFIKPPLVETQEMLSEPELQTLESVSKRFKGKSTKEIIDISHEESAWKNNINDKNIISYNYSFDLKML